MSTVSFCGITLVWDDFYWLGKCAVPHNIELLVDSEDEQPVPPCIDQETAWLRFAENHDAIHLQLLGAVFNYYTEMRPKYESMGPAWIENMPPIKSPSDLEGMINLNSITVSWPYQSTDVRLGLSYSCTWDQEHGLGVVLAGEEIIEVGGADCAII